MKFFRWLLSNILLIIIVIGLIYTYVYWGNLTGSDTPGMKVISYLSGEPTFVYKQVPSHPHTATQGVTATRKNSPGHSVVSEHLTPKHPPTMKIVNEAKKDNAALLHAEQVANTASASAAPVPKTAHNSHKPLPQQPATVHYSQNKQSVKTFVGANVEKKLDRANAAGADVTLTPDAIRKVWIEARKSFYKHDYAQSEGRYKRIIAMTKNNYDAYGELGNVYFYQGKNDKAADAYMKAAFILIDMGQSNRARSLLGLMHYLNRDKARQLEQKLEAAQQRVSH